MLLAYFSSKLPYMNILLKGVLDVWWTKNKGVRLYCSVKSGTHEAVVTLSGVILFLYPERLSHGQVVFQDQ